MSIRIARIPGRFMLTGLSTNVLVVGSLALLMTWLCLAVPTTAYADDPLTTLREAAFDAEAQVLTLDFSGVVENSRVRVEVDGQNVPLDGAALKQLGATGTVVFALEASSSTAASLLTQEQAFAERVLDALPSGVRVGVVSFGDGTQQLTPLTTDRSAAAAALASIRPGTASALYQGVNASVATLAAGTEPRSIVLLTFGWDFGIRGDVTRESSIAAARASGAAVHTVAFGGNYDLVYFNALAASGGSVITLPGGLAPASLVASLAQPLTRLSLPVTLSGGEHRLGVSVDGVERQLVILAPVAATPVASPDTQPAATPAATAAPITKDPDVGSIPGSPVLRPTLILLAVIALGYAASFAFVKLRSRVRPTPTLPSSTNLRRAMARGELQLHYQPVFDAKSQRLVGAESLLRWSGAAELSTARSFLGRAETLGLMPEVSELVVPAACDTASAMGQAGFPRFFVSVNLSRTQLLDERIVPLVRSVVAGSGLPADRLQFEIAEQTLLGDDRVIEVARKLQAIGVGLILDDFWAIDPDALQSLPALRSVKVDIQLITGEVAQRQLRRAVTAAHARGIPVVAKRVGTPAHRALAIELGCDFVQGDAQSAVLPASDLLRSAEQGLFERPNSDTPEARTRGLDVA